MHHLTDKNSINILSLKKRVEDARDAILQNGPYLYHEGMYSNKDMAFCIVLILSLPDIISASRDPVLLQWYIESFLLYSCRIRDDLIKELIENGKLPIAIRKEFISLFDASRAGFYYIRKDQYRHRAAHGTNYSRVGIIELGNEVMPKPLNYYSTQSLENMVNLQDWKKMWMDDIALCGQELVELYEWLGQKVIACKED